MDTPALLTAGTFAATTVFLFGPHEHARSWAQGAIMTTAVLTLFNEAFKLKRMMYRTLIVNHVKDRWTEDFWTTAKYHVLSLLESAVGAVDQTTIVQLYDREVEDQDDEETRIENDEANQ